jgi:hypothetical protein
MIGSNKPVEPAIMPSKRMDRSPSIHEGSASPVLLGAKDVKPQAFQRLLKKLGISLDPRQFAELLVRARMLKEPTQSVLRDSVSLVQRTLTSAAAGLSGALQSLFSEDFLAGLRYAPVVASQAASYGAQSPAHADSRWPFWTGGPT